MVIEIATEQEYANFEGAQLLDKSNIRSKIAFIRIYFSALVVNDYSYTHLREIPGSKLLVSLNHCYDKYATLEIFDLRNKGRATKVYSLDAVLGCNYKLLFCYLNE